LARVTWIQPEVTPRVRHSTIENYCDAVAQPMGDDLLRILPVLLSLVDAALVFVFEVPNAVAAEEAVAVTRHCQPRGSAVWVLLEMNWSKPSWR